LKVTDGTAKEMSEAAAATTRENSERVLQALLGPQELAPSSQEFDHPGSMIIQAIGKELTIGLIGPACSKIGQKRRVIANCCAGP
jgi:hypothetical protein